MPLSGGIDFRENRTDVAVVGFDHGCIELVQVLLQREIDFGERTDLHGDRLGEIAQQMGRQGGNLPGTGLEREIAFQVGGNADGRPVEIDTGEGHVFSRLRIGHMTFDTGCLRRTGDTDKEEEDEPEAFHFSITS